MDEITQSVVDSGVINKWLEVGGIVAVVIFALFVLLLIFQRNFMITSSHLDQRENAITERSEKQKDELWEQLKAQLQLCEALQTQINMLNERVRIEQEAKAEAELLVARLRTKLEWWEKHNNEGRPTPWPLPTTKPNA